MSRKRGFPGSGLSTLLLVFVILCLIIFSVLSLSTAKADLEMSQKVADRTQDYYQAQSKASERLKEIDAALAKQYNENKENYLEAAREALKKEAGLTVTEKEGGNRLFCVYTESVNETQQLRVELEIESPEEEAGTYVRILGWENVQIMEWDAETGLPVMKKIRKPEGIQRP